MVDYGSRIASLKAEQTRLIQRESELAAQRHEEIGKLADRIGVLEVEDDVLAGLFLELKTAITNGNPCLSQWREAGFRFRSAKSHRQRLATTTPRAISAHSHRDA